MRVKDFKINDTAYHVSGELWLYNNKKLPLEAWLNKNIFGKVPTEEDFIRCIEKIIVQLTEEDTLSITFVTCALSKTTLTGTASITISKKESTFHIINNILLSQGIDINFGDEIEIDHYIKSSLFDILLKFLVISCRD